MRLECSRDEVRTFFGGSKFRLKARLRLEPAEEQLVRRHGLERFPIVGRDALAEFNSDTAHAILKQAFPLVCSFTAGVEYDFKRLDELAAFEEAVNEGCRQLRTEMQSLATEEQQLGTSTFVDF